MKHRESKTLGPLSAKFIQQQLERGKTIFTLNEAQEIYGKSRQQTSNFISKLVGRQVLAQLKPGLYIIQVMGQEAIGLTQWPIIARELVGKNNYFLSHYSAMRLHGMTTHPIITTYITTTRRQTDKFIHNINYKFIYSKPEHFWGWMIQWASQQEKIKVSNLERTMLDALDRPELCGGIKEVINGIWIKHKLIDVDRLIKYANGYRSKASVKRLGFILETIEVSSRLIVNLNKAILNTKSYSLFNPDGEHTGKYTSKWRLRVNFNIDEIKEIIRR